MAYARKDTAMTFSHVFLSGRFMMALVGFAHARFKLFWPKRTYWELSGRWRPSWLEVGVDAKMCVDGRGLLAI